MTLCEKCGSFRDGIPSECPACQYRPDTLEALARAAVLTAEFAEGGDESLGTPRARLLEVAEDIRAGKPVVLDAAEVRRHREAVAAFLVAEPTATNIAYALFRMFLPGIVIFVALIALLLLRWVR